MCTHTSRSRLPQSRVATHGNLWPRLVYLSQARGWCGPIRSNPTRG